MNYIVGGFIFDISYTVKLHIFTHFVCSNDTQCYFDCDDVGIETSHSEINGLFHWVKRQGFFHLEISVSHWHLCNNII